MEQTLPAVEGPLERQVRPHAWIVEWGAASLPLGDPSRVTCKSVHDTRAEAEEALFQARREFDAHMYQVAPVSPQPGGGEAMRCIAPLCKPLGCVLCNCAVPADVYAVLMRAERAADFAWTVEDQAAVDADTGCAWTQDNDEGSDTWATACGRLFCVTEGTPAENNMRFCCYCGEALQEHALLPEADDAA